MKIIRGISSLRSCQKAGAGFPGGTVVTAGAFDGVHKGHQAVLETVVKRAAKLGVPSVVLTLEPLPREYFKPLLAPPRLMSLREKAESLRALGIDYLLVLKFDEQLRRVDAKKFARDIFVEQLKCRHMIIGDDFQFGRDADGDLDLLIAIGKDHGFEVEAAETFSMGGERVSSSRIRNALEASRFDEVEELLGRPYTISGKVVYGQQLGRELGVPTANIELHRLRTALAGVYTAEVKIAGENLWRAGVANVGVRPTVDDSIKAILEVHLLDYEGELYGKRLQVRFCSRIRDEKKFDSLDELKQQIHEDLNTARRSFGGT